jgi:hypothetical protein
MDHTTVALASFPPSRSYDLRARFGHYWLDDARGRHVYLHGVGLSEKAQAADRLLNCHAYFEDIGHVDNDPWDALKRLKSSVRSRRVSLADARLVLAHAGEIGKGLYRRRFQHRPQLPPVKRVEIQLMLEQMPDPESRVTLSEAKRDALGMPISRIHWKISDTERLTANRMARAIGQEFKILRLPLPEGLSQWQDTSDWASGWIERAHPSGTTRMSNNPNEGVVDANCQVHGVRGLFVAGSSVFPTSGAANPTLMIVATALRLADHLKAAI